MKILPILADIANGVFATVFAGYVTGTEILWWHFLIGIPLAMLPDLDAIPELMHRGKISFYVDQPKYHRDGLHYPIVFLIAGVALIFFVPFWGWLFLTATMLHFVNDLYGTGFGIQLFWPFSNRYFKFFTRRAGWLRYMLREYGIWDQLSMSERKVRFYVSIKKDDMPGYMKQWGLDQWIEPYYLRLNWVSGVEYSLFVLALLVVAVTLLY